MFVELFFGLFFVITASAVNERIDLSSLAGPMVITTQDNKWTPMEVDEAVDDDSSEAGVTPGKLKTTCKCGWTNRSGKRIVGGKVHEPNEYPWIVGVSAGHSPNRPHCGGSLITHWHVVTAAHCTVGYQSLAVTAGDYDRTGFKVSSIHRVKTIFDHEQYNKVLLKNDISLLELTTPIVQSDKVGLVCLPQSNQNLNGEKVRIIGWGALVYQGPMTVLPKKTDMTVVDIHSCSLAWPFHISTFPQTQLCTFTPGTTACQGDSGGPVVHLNKNTNRYALAGIVSFGPYCLTSQAPAVQTLVASYLQWIKEKIELSKPGTEICT